MKNDIDKIAGEAALFATIAADTQTEVSIVMQMNEAVAAKLAGFVRIAGNVGGEPLFLWSSGRDLHPIKAKWADLSPALRQWFEIFASVSGAVARVLAPPPTENLIPVAPSRPVPLGDTIFERVDGVDDKLLAGEGGKTLSTADVQVIPMRARGYPPAAPATRPEGVAPDAILSGPAPIAIDQAGMEAAMIPGGGAVSIHALREQIQRMDPSNHANLMKERPDPAPPIDAGEVMAIEGVDPDGGKLAGRVRVTPPARRR